MAQITYGSGKKVETPIFGSDPTLERREIERRHRNIALTKYYDEKYREHLQREKEKEASYERAKTATERKIGRKIKKAKGGVVKKAKGGAVKIEDVALRGMFKSSRKKNIDGIARRGKTRAKHR
jgi:hypothetical protein|tara:strand:- start:178 stop:549 length:372 start_codon:yes stop_codon:yes gene_type:complete